MLTLAIALVMLVGLEASIGAQEEPLEVRLEKTAGIRADAARAFFNALASMWARAIARLPAR